MAISRKSTEPTGITNAAGEPEILLEVEGLTLSFAPPRAPEKRTPDIDDDEGGLRL